MDIRFTIPRADATIQTVMNMTKDSVLSELIKSGGCISGESVSASLGLSRAAVNSAVQNLRREGYDIASSTRTGYTLLSSPDRLRPGELEARLGRERMETVICLDSVDSTNNYLKALALSGAPAGTAVVANAQTAGRGRLGRSFHSPADEGIYLSFLLRPDCGAEAAPQLTAWAAAAMCGAVEAASGLRPGIKWVNDLVVKGRKLSGILTEMSVEAESGHIQFVVLGVGINVSQSVFPPELSDIATSISMESGRHISRCELAAEMIRALDGLSRDFPTEKPRYLEAYRRDCAILGRELSYTLNGRSVSARAESIDDDFGLTVQRSDGARETLRAGEVSVSGLYGRP